MSITPEIAWEAFKKSDMLHSSEAVAKAYDQMAERISVDLKDKNPVLVCVLNGGVTPFSEIMKRLEFPLQTDYIHATRYNGQLTGGELQWLAEPRMNPSERDILIIDDILDEGKTLSDIVEYYKNKGSASVRSAVLVVKDRQRKIDYMADYVGLHVPDRYVFGCGMDYKSYLRNLPGIYAEN